MQLKNYPQGMLLVPSQSSFRHGLVNQLRNTCPQKIIEADCRLIGFIEDTDRYGMQSFCRQSRMPARAAQKTNIFTSGILHRLGSTSMMQISSRFATLLAGITTKPSRNSCALSFLPRPVFFARRKSRHISSFRCLTYPYFFRCAPNGYWLRARRLCRNGFNSSCFRAGHNATAAFL